MNAPSFTELARAKRRTDAMAIIYMMSLREQADLAYHLISEVLPCTDEMGDAVYEVCKAFDASWKAIDAAIDADEWASVHPSERGPSFGMHHPDSPSFGSGRVA